MYPFRKGSFAVHNGWYVAAFTHEIGRALLSRTILNLPVVIYRKEDGTAVAVGGRCPHRHYPLGASCLTGDTIVCGYHGITFDADGRCVNIPSQEHAPKSYRIPTYPLVEHGIWAFIWMGNPDKADPALLPDLDAIGYDLDGHKPEPFYVEHVHGRYQLLNDNLLDLTHLAFLHGSTIGSIDNAAVPEELTVRPGFFGSRRIMKNADAPPVHQHVGHGDAKIDRVSGMDFYLPGFHAGIDETRVPESDPERGGELIRTSRVFHAVTPATLTSCTYFFASNSADREGLEFMKGYLRPVIEEDKFATEEIEKMLAIVGEEPGELLIKSDRNAVEARRMLQKMMDEESEAVPA
jgi:vanillate O-demethylase monooxygenase subunit